MLGTLTSRAATTFAALLAAYGVSGLVAYALLDPSPVWFLVLGADFLLVAFCTVLARIADEEERGASIEALCIGIGTVAPLCIHGLQFASQFLIGQTQVASDSIIGAAIHGQWPEHADNIYLTTLAGAGVASASLAAVAALHARQSQDHKVSLGVGILLLVGSTLFLLPWFGGASSRASPLSLINALVALALITSLLWGASLLLRTLLAAAHAAGRAAASLIPIAIGAAIVGAVVVLLYWVFSILMRIAGPIFDGLQLVVTALAWFVFVATLLAVVVATARFVVLIVGLVVERLSRTPWRGGALAACALLLTVALVLVVGRGGQHERSIPPPPARVVFEDAPIACAGFRWEYGETARISVPVENCLVYSQADILVAVGSATPPGGADTEPVRALQRARALADAIVAHISAQGDRPRVFVLNRGIESVPPLDEARLGPRLAVLAGKVTPAGARIDDAILHRDLSAYLRERADASQYTHCDFYSLAGAAPPIRLECRTNVEDD